MTTSLFIPPITSPATPPEQLPPQSLEFRAKLKWRIRAKLERLRLWWLHYKRRSLFSSLMTMPSMPVIPHPTAPPPLAWPTSSVTRPLAPLFFGDDEITEKRAALGQTTKPLVVIKGLHPGEFRDAFREEFDSGTYPTMDDAVAAAVDKLTGNEDIHNPFTNGVLQQPFPELPPWHPASQKMPKRIRMVKLPPSEPTPPPPKPTPQVTWAEKIMIEHQETLPHHWRIS